jgi:hypothetical protein
MAYYQNWDIKTQKNQIIDPKGKVAMEFSSDVDKDVITDLLHTLNNRYENEINQAIDKWGLTQGIGYNARGVARLMNELLEETEMFQPDHKGEVQNMIEGLKNLTLIWQQELKNYE